MSSSLRARLTLWYVSAFSLVLIGFSAGVYFFVEGILHERMDSNLRLTLQMTSSALARHLAGGPSLAFRELGQVGYSSVAEALDDPRLPGQIIAVLDSDGRVLARKPASSALVFRLPALPLRASPSPQFYELPESNSEADDSCRGIYQLAAAGSDVHLTIVVTDSMEALGDQLDTLQNVLAIAGVLALMLAGSGGWLLARQSLSPLAVMASATERITANDLSERLPVVSSDELGRLASRFNDLLSRLNTSFSQQRQFMTDASHELRTPISVVRTAAQVALQKPQRPDSEYRQSLAVIEQQAGRLSRIVENMFALTRADMHQLPLDISELYLDEVIALRAPDYWRSARAFTSGRKTCRKRHIAVTSACCGKCSPTFSTMRSNSHRKAEPSTFSSTSSAIATRLRSSTPVAAFLTNFSPGSLNVFFAPTRPAPVRMGQTEPVWVSPLHVPLPSCTTAGSLFNTPDRRAALSAFACPSGSRCEHSLALVTRNRLKEEVLRGNLLLHFLEQPRREFEDVGSSLSGLWFEIDPNRSYQFPARIMQWRCHIETIRLVFHKWLSGLHRRRLVLITLFPQILGFCGSYRDAALLTSRRSGEF